MKAMVQDKYGAPHDVLALKDIDAPVTNDDQVLIRVHAAGVQGELILKRLCVANCCWIFEAAENYWTFEGGAFLFFLSTHIGKRAKSG